jgi:O-antigen/teichoic acid export membrane protein
MYPRFSKAALNKDDFSRVLRMAFRPLLLVALLGAIGTFLFADTAIGFIYSREKFEPAGAILRAFAPVLLLVYVSIMFGQAIMALGRAAPLAWVKLASVVVTTALEFVLIPWSQARFENGGVGVMFALAGGELLMVVAAVVLIRDSINRGMFVDLLRGLAVGAGTIATMQLLPVIPWFIGVPLCIGSFLGLCFLAGLLHRDDLQLLVESFSNRGSADTAAAPSH